MEQTFLYQVDLELEVLPVWLVDPHPPVVIFRKTLNLYRKFQFIGNSKVTQYFVTIVRSHFQLLKFHIKTHGVAGKQYVFSAQKARKRSFFSQALAGISILAQVKLFSEALAGYPPILCIGPMFYIGPKH